MEHKMILSLSEKTGRSLNQWKKLLDDEGLSKHGEIVRFLKSKHTVTHGYANLIAHKYLHSDAGSSDDRSLVENQFVGKEALKLIYDNLISKIKTMGPDIEFAPKKAYTSVRRKKQFAILQPSTKSRFDIGLNIPHRHAEGRLELSGSFNSMCSHRVRLENINDIDDELIGWISEAYEQAG